MTRLITPRPKNVGFVTAIVFPIHGPIGVIMFPDKSASHLCLAYRDIAGNEQSPLKVATVFGCFERGDQGFTAMHICVLATIREQCFPIAGRLISIETVFWRPEALFHEIESLFEIFFPLIQASTERIGVGEKNKSEAIAMVGGICDLGLTVQESQDPRIASSDWIAMHIAKEG